MHAIRAAHSRNRPFSIIALEDDNDAEDDSHWDDASAEADDSGETEESGGEASGAEDIDDAAEASAPVILGSSIRNTGGVGGDGDAAEAGHANAILATGSDGFIAKSSDGRDPFDTANHIFSRGWLCTSECPFWRKKHCF